MYSTCLFCANDLGRNDVLETLPIGRRLAFDAAEGRLWVICPSCAGWNLVPFDSRLETIDKTEGMFRDARLRFSTDHIGLARLREGLELVRIGPALRPEFAAWRYGDRFANRRKRNIVIGSALAVVGVGAVIGAEVLLGGVFVSNFLVQGGAGAYRRCRIATRVTRGDAVEPLTLSLDDIRRSEVVRDGSGWGLKVPARTGVRGRWTLGAKTPERTLLSGSDARLALGQMLASIAGTAGSRKQLHGAVEIVEAYPSLDQLVTRRTPVWTKRGGGNKREGLSTIGVETRLALEMLAHEESERQWLAGELRVLEEQWRAADRLAAIADDLALTDEVRELWRERRREPSENG